MNSGIGTNYGFVNGEHQIPPGFFVVDVKQCENCSATFVRRHRTGIKYCGRCISKCLMPIDLTDYKEGLPTEAESRHSHHLPHYDDSLLPEKQQVHSPRMPIPIQRRARRDYGDWRARLVQEFNKCGTLTSEQIQDVIGCTGIPANALSIAKDLVVRVGWGKKKYPELGGRPPGIYALAGTVQ